MFACLISRLNGSSRRQTNLFADSLSNSDLAKILILDLVTYIKHVMDYPDYIQILFSFRIFWQFLVGRSKSVEGRNGENDRKGKNSLGARVWGLETNICRENTDFP